MTSSSDFCDADFELREDLEPDLEPDLERDLDGVKETRDAVGEGPEEDEEDGRVIVEKNAVCAAPENSSSKENFLRLSFPFHGLFHKVI